MDFNSYIMSIICKTGCGQQVVYNNIEFTDGFVFQCPHNLDDSLHYCPIFYDDSSLFGAPQGGYAFDSNPYRENSYGAEIENVGNIFYEFDMLVISKNKNLSVKDVEIYKTRLQSFLNIFPINGLYTDVLNGFYDLDKQSFENASKSGVLSDSNNKNYSQVHFTLSSTPLIALKKIYYILEGNSTNFKKCQQLDKEISDNDPTKMTNNYEVNPFELQLLDAQKQLDIFEKKFEKDPQNKKIKDVIKFYHALIDGIPSDQFDKIKFNGAGSAGIKDQIKDWYQDKKLHLENIKLAKEEGIPINKFLEECNNWEFNNWNYMPKKMKLEWLEGMDIISHDTPHILNLTFGELEKSFPKITDELIDSRIYGSEHSHKLAKQRVESHVKEIEQGLFDPNKIRKLIHDNAKKDVEDIVEELLIISPELTESSWESEKHEPLKYNYNTHFEKNSIVHLSNSEKHLRELIINQIFDHDIDFMKKHFKPIWTGMDDIKLRDKKNISSPKEETELDYATFGQLIEILRNKETTNRVKRKNIEGLSDLIRKIEVILPYRNQLDHSRGTVNGDLEPNTKLIVYGICNEIDTFCSSILYK